MDVARGEFAFVRPLDITRGKLVAAYPLLLVVAVAAGYVSAKLFFQRLDTPATTAPETER